jgi:hypothetical protein
MVYECDPLGDESVTAVKVTMKQITIVEMGKA